jgi:hypothetical protein
MKTNLLDHEARVAQRAETPSKGCNMDCYV